MTQRLLIDRLNAFCEGVFRVLNTGIERKPDGSLFAYWDSDRDVRVSRWTCVCCLLASLEDYLDEEKCIRHCEFEHNPPSSGISPSAKLCTRCEALSLTCQAPPLNVKPLLDELNENIRLFNSTDEEIGVWLHNQEAENATSSNTTDTHTAQVARIAAYDHVGRIVNAIVILMRRIFTNQDSTPLHSGAVDDNENPDAGVSAPIHPELTQSTSPENSD